MSREFIREDYLKLTIEFTPVLPAREVAIAYLSELQFEGFESTDKGLIAHVSNLKIDRAKLEEVKIQLDAIADKMVWDEAIVKTENWNAKWEEEYEPVNVENKVLIRAPFHPIKEGALDVIIKPNMSFGTGHHDTTWMIVKSLITINVKSEKVLDMGCGTGVLAIVAKLLGASSITAIDIEEGAVKNTIENAQLNGIQESNSFKVDCGTSELLKSNHQDLFHIILANINKNILISDLCTYTNALKEGGRIVLSGFFKGDVEQMTNAIQAEGLNVIDTIDRNGWACIICGKTAL